jgi:hypothetical protein
MLAFKPINRPRWWFEVSRGLPVLLAFVVLDSSHVVVGDYFGKGWALIAAVTALILWPALRPWRLGLLSREERKGINILCSIGLVGHALVAAEIYWHHHKNF